jgi:YXWGXW repeat-containing protein
MLSAPLNSREGSNSGGDFEMSKLVLRTFDAVMLAAIFAASAAAQLPPPPAPIRPPLPDEIRPTIVEVAPPPLRVEATVARPGPAYVWTRGYWDWAGRSWAWLPGRWVTAPTAGASWVPARYARVATGWKYVPAHWSNQRVVTVEGAGRGSAVGHRKAKGKGHSKGKGQGHRKHH